MEQNDQRKTEVLKLLNELINIGRNTKELNPFFQLGGPDEQKYDIKTQNFAEWKYHTIQYLKRVFGENNDYFLTFNNIMNKAKNVNYTMIDEGIGLLQVLKDNIEFGICELESEMEEKPGQNPTISDFDAISKVELICKRFHAIALQLRKRQRNRQPFEINDEYDVQDLLHAQLKLFFNNIRPEEYAPSYGGSSNRMDFLLKNEDIVIEVKKTRDTLKTKQIGDELTNDIAHYKTHPNCKTLICFVYDPDSLIDNPFGLKDDIEQQSNDDMEVIVYIEPHFD